MNSKSRGKQIFNKIKPENAWIGTKSCTGLGTSLELPELYWDEKGEKARRLQTWIAVQAKLWSPHFGLESSPFSRQLLSACKFLCKFYCAPRKRTCFRWRAGKDQQSIPPDRPLKPPSCPNFQNPVSWTMIPSCQISSSPWSPYQNSTWFSTWKGMVAVCSSVFEGENGGKTRSPLKLCSWIGLLYLEKSSALKRLVEEKGWYSIIEKQNKTKQKDQNEPSRGVLLLNVWIDFRKCMNWFKNMGSEEKWKREMGFHESIQTITKPSTPHQNPPTDKPPNTSPFLDDNPENDAVLHGFSKP